MNAQRTDIAVAGLRHVTAGLLAFGGCLVASTLAMAAAPDADPAGQATAEWLAAINRGDYATAAATFSDDAAVMGPAGPIWFGPAEVAQSIAYLTKSPGFHVDFTPERSGLSRDGEMGFVVGHSAINAPGPGTTRHVTRQRLLLIWRKDAAGQWKCLFDVVLGRPD